MSIQISPIAMIHRLITLRKPFSGISSLRIASKTSGSTQKMVLMVQIPNITAPRTLFRIFFSKRDGPVDQCEPHFSPTRVEYVASFQTLISGA